VPWCQVWQAPADLDCCVMRALVALVVTVAVGLGASSAVGERSSLSARAPAAAEGKQIDAAIRSWWCANLTTSERPCSQWTLGTLTVRLSTAAPAWGYAQISDHAHAVSTDLPGEVRLLLRRTGGEWGVYRWFIGFRGHSCADVAGDVHVPYRAMQDLGLCAFVAELP
jgi:hypothetical protein